MTQNDAVLRMLKLHPEGVTALDALQVLGVARMAARVYELVKAGHWIDTEMVRRGTRHGWANVALYRLINTKEEKI